MITLASREDSALTARVLDAIPTAIICLSQRDIVTLANPAAETLFGRSAPLLCGRPLTDVIAPDCPFLDFLSMARRQGGTVSARRVRLSGSSIGSVDVDVTSSRDPVDDMLVLSLSVVRAEQEDGPAEVTAFAHVARMLGHEVKNPLAGIVGAAQLLARKADDSQQPLLSLIREEGARIQRIVDRFTAFETFFSPRTRPTNVHEVLDSVLGLAAASFASRTRIEQQYDPSLPEIEVDPDHLHEACLNLVKNAAEAAAQNTPNPRITVTTRYRSDFRFAGRDTPRARGALEISVQDNGTGLPDGVATRVFEPFFTTKSGGAGVGLAVVAEIASAHGGHASISNNPGGGAIARLLFPIHRKKGASRA
ncbi:MAG: ATP-binding protein [Hyphomonadaceae bacterium]